MVALSCLGRYCVGYYLSSFGAYGIFGSGLGSGVDVNIYTVSSISNMVIGGNLMFGDRLELTMTRVYNGSYDMSGCVIIMKSTGAVMVRACVFIAIIAYFVLHMVTS